MSKEKDDTQKGEIEMNAYAMKPNRPFIAKATLERTPASESNRKMAEFMDSHNFSVRVDKATGKSNCVVTRR